MQDVDKLQMERGMLANPGNGSGPSPTSGEQKSPREGKRTRNRKRNGRHSAAINFESTQSTAPSSHAEAIIWERPSTPQPQHEESIKVVQEPVLANIEKEQSGSQALPEQVKPKTLIMTEERRPMNPPIPEEDNSWVDDFVMLPKSNYLPHVQPEVPPMPQEEPALRRFFWNEADVRQPDQTAIEHDILPPVFEAPKPVSEITIVPPPIERTPNPLEQAVNPSMTANELVPPVMPQIPPTEAVPARASGLGALMSPATNFLTRRRSGVKSQPMNPGSFEQNPMQDLQDEIVPPTFFATEFPEQVMSQNFEPVAEIAEIKPPFAFNEAPEHSGHIGHMLVNAEQPSQEQAPAVAPRSPEQNLQATDLTELAQNIRIDGVSLQEMYTAKRIDEEGLRRIVAEYLRGGDVRKMIASEVMRQQVKYERDPQLRGVPVVPAAIPVKEHAPRKPIRSRIDLEKTIDRTEKLAEFTQQGFSRARHYFRTNPHATTVYSIVAITVIYSLILIVALSK